MLGSQKNKRVFPKRKKNLKIIWHYRIKKLIKILPIFAIFIIIIFLLWQFLLSDFFKFKVIILNKNHNIDNEQILVAIDNLIKYPINISEIKSKIIQNIWVKDVQIDKKSNVLKINIIPQIISFNWVNLVGDKKGYLNENGQLLMIKNINKNTNITIISNKKYIYQAFINLKKYKKIYKGHIKKFIKTSIETIILANGAKIILGQKLQVNRLKKLQKYYHLFKIKANSIIDLRYKNGFAKTN